MAKRPRKTLWCHRPEVLACALKARNHRDTVAQHLVRVEPGPAAGNRVARPEVSATHAKNNNEDTLQVQLVNKYERPKHFLKDHCWRCNNLVAHTSLMFVAASFAPTKASLASCQRISIGTIGKKIAAQRRANQL
jgi:hypothetical protein